MQLNLLFINDVHGYLNPHNELFYNANGEYTETVGGYSRIAALTKRIRAENEHTLFFDGGDTFHGTHPVVDTEGEALIPVLNKMSLSAMVGHWDFAYGPKQLKNILSKLHYPMLGINVYNDDGTLFLKPTVTLQVAHLKIGVIGICSNIIDKTMPQHFSKGLKITNGIEELPTYITQLKAENADLIILLSHNGLPQDVETLKRVGGIDVCLSAHTHNRLYKPIYVNDTIVIQCGCHGSFLGHLKIEVENKRITKHEYELIKVSNDIQPDLEVQERVNQILTPYQKQGTDIVGSTKSTLHRYDTLNSSMDALLLNAVKFATNTEISFSNGWRYGAPIVRGNITQDDLFNIIPMDPVVSTVALTGQEIINMLEENLERTFAPNPMKQMGGYVKRCSGLRVNLRIENPKGSRIQEIYFKNAHLDVKQTYLVSFVTSQGVSKDIGTNRTELNLKAVAAITNYLKVYPNFCIDENNVFNLV